MDFLDIDLSKHEILDSTSRLLQLGVDKDALRVIICSTLFLLEFGYDNARKLFQNKFGNSFVDKINELYETGALQETLYELYDYFMSGDLDWN